MVGEMQNDEKNTWRNSAGINDQARRTFLKSRMIFLLTT